MLFKLNHVCTIILGDQKVILIYEKCVQIKSSSEHINCRLIICNKHYLKHRKYIICTELLKRIKLKVIKI